MGDTIKTLLHNILEGKYSSNSTHTAAAERNYDLENFQMMKDAYETCMNQDAIKSYGIKPVSDIVDEFEKIFPAKGKPVYGGSNEELTNTIIWLAKQSVSGLVSSDTSVSPHICFGLCFRKD
jgi:endothelin-converting enzyme